jgi:hypothetical protein
MKIFLGDANFSSPGMLLHHKTCIMIFINYISGSSSNQKCLLPYQPTQTKEMNPFLCYAFPRDVPLLSRDPVHSSKKFQSCDSGNSSCNKSIGISSFYDFIIELNFILVIFFPELQYSIANISYSLYTYSHHEISL